MDPTTISVTVARPREEVFEYLADVANHAEFTDHFLVDWHLLREDSYGLGAGARYRIRMPLNRQDSPDDNFVSSPHRTDFFFLGPQARGNRHAGPRRQRGEIDAHVRERFIELRPDRLRGRRNHYRTGRESLVIGDHALQGGAPRAARRELATHCALR